MKSTVIALLVAACSAVQLKDDYFFARHAGRPAYGLEAKYERVVPMRFSGNQDDIFMRSMIEQYALEERTKVVEHDDGLKTGGEPSGKFWMNQAAANAAAKEVLTTHKGLTGKLLDDYITTYFGKAWGHFDVNQTGFIEVIKMPQFMRFLCSDQYMSLGESG